MTAVELDDGGRLTIDAAADPRAVLLLGHGAGGRIDVADLHALAGALPDRGVTVIRHTQPWKVAGGKVTARPPVLDRGWATAVRHVVDSATGLPLLTGGHSAGARCACRGTASPDLPTVAAVVALSFPLHPPGQPAKSRVEELLGVDRPVLVVQGERDPFGGPDEIRAATGSWFDQGVRRLVPIPGAGHDLVPAARVMPRRDALAFVVETVLSFVDEVV